MNVESDELLPTRRSLLSRLKDWEDQESWWEFFNTYWRLIYTMGRRSGLSNTDAREVVQETVIAVARKMPGFTYDPAVDSFKGWLFYLTRKQISKAYRKRRQEQGGRGLRPRVVSLSSDIEALADPEGDTLEAVWEREWEENLMKAALERVKQRVDPKQYQAFNYYVLKQWSARDVAETLGVKMAWVYLAKHRISRRLKQEISKLKKEPLT